MLIPGQLPTPELPKRISLIFPWAGFSQRSPIPIFNPLLKTGAHSYSASPKYNQIPNSFRNRFPLLVLTCWQCEDKLNVSFEKIIDECSFTLIFDSCWHVLFLTYSPKNIKLMSIMLPKSVILILFFTNLVLIKIGQCYLYMSLTDSKIVREIMIYDT